MIATFRSALACALFALPFLAQPASAGNIAKRCDAYDCNVIRCNHTGDRCVRLDRSYYGHRHHHYNYYRDSNFRPRYERYADNGYSGHARDYDGDSYRDYDPDYKYRHDKDRYDRHAYYDRDDDRYRRRHRHGSRRVCDSDGDRCYHSREGWWNYREYYRRHGYSWRND